MIRTAYPVPTIRQFRLRLDLATRRTRRALEQRCRALRGATDRFTGVDVRRSAEEKAHAFSEDTATLRIAVAERLTPSAAAREMLTRYEEFEAHYDGLIGLLCTAANEGNNPRFEAHYQEQRGWFEENYHRIKPQVTRYLNHSAEDAAPTDEGLRPCDAFEALFLPSSIAAMLDADSGELIDRFLRTQAALATWYPTLRREAVIQSHIHP